MNTVSEFFELAMPCDLAVIQDMIVEEPGRAFGKYGEVRVTSCFQPVFSLAHGHAVGFEALLRARDADDKAVAPMVMFDQTEEFDQILMLDRLSCTVHVNNFLQQPNADGWLFVNMNPQVFIESVGSDSFLSELFARYQLPSSRIVIELLEESETQDDVLADAIAACRTHGCLIAFDDFDASAEALDRVWALRPDIVKIARGLTARAVHDRKARHALGAAIQALHDMGCLALLQGVETAEEAELALECHADFAEGYFLGHPEFEVPEAPALSAVAASVGAGFRNRSLTALSRQRDRLAAYLSGLWSATVLLESGLCLELAAAGLLELDATLSCFLLDAQGGQVGKRVITARPTPEPQGFARLRSIDGVNYAHRACFLDAWARPGKIQVTGSEFGSLTRVSCTTISTTVQIGSALHVLCAELNWNQFDPS
jgi:EAL domain-containing protein (putative c-di-GMP-specific phosphodiesterase class I)